MKVKLLDNLLVQKDEDLRKSLFPFINPMQTEGPRLTRFIRDKDSHMQVRLNYNIYEDESIREKVNFNTAGIVPLNNQQLTFSQILQRYKDNSLIIKTRPKQNRYRFLQGWSKILHFLLQQKQQPIIFKKDSTFLLFWNMLILLCYLFNMFEIPIAIFFTSAVYRDEYNSVAGLILNWLIIMLIIINVGLVRPNTQFQKMGYLISNRTQIMDNYLNRDFMVDVFGTLILIIYSASQTRNLIYLKLFFYVELITVLQIDELILNKLQLLSFRYALYRLLRLLTYMLFIIIWLSSIFFFIDYNYYKTGQYTGSQNWLTSSICTYSVDYSTATTSPTDLITTYPQAWYIWLNYSAYWALQTISTVGYGDITPRNPVSVAFTNIAILIMMFFFVFFINSIIEIIDQMTSSQQKQKKNNIRKFKLYHRQAKNKMEQISLKYAYSQSTCKQNLAFIEQTSNSVRSYLHQMDINNLLDQEDNVEQLVNQNLTPQLRDQLFINYRQLFFKKVLFFGQLSKVSSHFMIILEQLIYKIKQISYGSSQVIYVQNQANSSAIYYLLKGSVILKYPLSRYTKIITYAPEQFHREQTHNVQQQYFNFGVRQFFTQQMRDHHAITESYCKIQVLQYQHFITIIRGHKDFYYKFCQLRDELMIGKTNILTGEQCFECKSKKHHLFECDKCLFNIRLNSQRTLNIQQKLQMSRRQHSIDNHRVQFYMRDCVRSQKLGHKSKVYLQKFRQEICNFGSYNSNRNLFSQYFR